MSSKTNLQPNYGFSLLEMLIVLAVFTFVVGGIFSSLNQSQVRYQFEQEVAELQQSGRNAVDLMERDQTRRFPKGELLRQRSELDYCQQQ